MSLHSSHNTVLIRGKRDVIENTNNSVYRYNFQSQIRLTEYDQISLSLINIYFSWYNIASDYNNNKFQYKFPDTEGVYQIYDVILDDGYYSIADINEKLITIMTANYHYLINTTTQGKTYYAEILSNATSYASQIKTYKFPLASEVGTSDNYTGKKFYYPWESANNTITKWAVSTASTPKIIILSNNNFKTILGFDAGTYPTQASQTENYSIISQNTPQVDVVSSVLVCCNLLENVYSDPSSLMYAFTTGSTSYGGMVEVKPNFLSFDSCKPGDYSFMEISFKDQDGKQLLIKDNDLLVMVNIRNIKT